MVEGLFDAIALHQLGFPETVAVLGSGLSEGQALLLKKAGVLEVYLAFDADEAGQKATLQSLNLELAPRFLFYAVRLPAKDPGAPPPPRGKGPLPEGPGGGPPRGGLPL